MNAINVIAPYKYLGMWVFDDAKVGLVQEPFVGGEGWLCPALLKYFAEPPKELYFQVEPKTPGK